MQDQRRVSPDVVVSGVVGYAASRAAAIPRCPRIVPIGVHVDPGPVGGLGEGWNGGGGLRRVVG
ncbi:MAG: hypothetical protein ABJL67_04215, partial [Sulfitobacter sp.]